MSLQEIKDFASKEREAYKKFNTALTQYVDTGETLSDTNPDSSNTRINIINASANTVANNALWNTWGFTIAADRELLMKQVRPVDTSAIETLKKDHTEFHTLLKTNIRKFQSLNSHIKDLYDTGLIGVGYAFRLYNKYRMSNAEATSKIVSTNFKFFHNIDETSDLKSMLKIDDFSKINVSNVATFIASANPYESATGQNWYITPSYLGFVYNFFEFYEKYFEASSSEKSSISNVKNFIKNNCTFIDRYNPFCKYDATATNIKTYLVSNYGSLQNLRTDISSLLNETTLSEFDTKYNTLRTRIKTATSSTELCLAANQLNEWIKSFFVDSFINASDSNIYTTCQGKVLRSKYYEIIKYHNAKINATKTGLSTISSNGIASTPLKTAVTSSETLLNSLYVSPPSFAAEPNYTTNYVTQIKSLYDAVVILTKINDVSNTFGKTYTRIGYAPPSFSPTGIKNIDRLRYIFSPVISYFRKTYMNTVFDWYNTKYEANVGQKINSAIANNTVHQTISSPFDSDYSIATILDDTIDKYSSSSKIYKFGTLSWELGLPYNTLYDDTTLLHTFTGISPDKSNNFNLNFYLDQKLVRKTISQHGNTTAKAIANKLRKPLGTSSALSTAIANLYNSYEWWYDSFMGFSTEYFDYLNDEGLYQIEKIVKNSKPVQYYPLNSHVDLYNKFLSSRAKALLFKIERSKDLTSLYRSVSNVDSAAIIKAVEDNDWLKSIYDNKVDITKNLKRDKTTLKLFGTVILSLYASDDVEYGYAQLSYTNVDYPVDRMNTLIETYVSTNAL